jgi:hypothetical protein
MGGLMAIGNQTEIDRTAVKAIEALPLTRPEVEVQIVSQVRETLRAR